MSIELMCGGARAVILPEMGGRLHQVWVPIGDRAEPLLHSPEDPIAYEERPTRGGSFPMAPWPNRVAQGRFRWAGRDFELPRDGKPHAIHGRVLGQAWDVVVSEPAVCELVAQFDSAWPWRGYAWQRFELTPGALRMALEVRSYRERFPAGCGWHPWFRRDVAGATDVELLVPAAHRYVLRDQIPTGKRIDPSGESDLRHRALVGGRRLDDCYSGLTGAVGIGWGRVRLAISIECREPHAMVYTPPEAICVEPQTCPPDVFNLVENGVAGTGMGVAAPGAPVRIASTWSWAIAAR